MMDKKEVKKIIHPECYEIGHHGYPCPIPDWGACSKCDELAQQICQLSEPKPKEYSHGLTDLYRGFECPTGWCDCSSCEHLVEWEVDASPVCGFKPKPDEGGWRENIADVIFPFRWFFSNNRDDALDLADQIITQVASICQLEPKRSKKREQGKPDESKLLTDEDLICPFLFEMDGQRYKFVGCKTWQEAEWAKKAWDEAVAKTASIKDIEWIKACMRGGILIANSKQLIRVLKAKDAQCQARVERILRRIEKIAKSCPEEPIGKFLDSLVWQALIKEEISG